MKLFKYSLFLSAASVLAFNSSFAADVAAPLAPAPAEMTGQLPVANINEPAVHLMVSGATSAVSPLPAQVPQPALPKLKKARVQTPEKIAELQKRVAAKNAARVAKRKTPEEIAELQRQALEKRSLRPSSVDSDLGALFDPVVASLNPAPADVAALAVPAGQVVMPPADPTLVAAPTAVTGTAVPQLLAPDLLATPATVSGALNDPLNLAQTSTMATSAAGSVPADVASTTVALAPADSTLATGPIAFPQPLQIPSSLPVAEQSPSAIVSSQAAAEPTMVLPSPLENPVTAEKQADKIITTLDNAPPPTPTAEAIAAELINKELAERTQQEALLSPAATDPTQGALTFPLNSASAAAVAPTVTGTAPPQALNPDLLTTSGELNDPLNLAQTPTVTASTAGADVASTPLEQVVAPAVAGTVVQQPVSPRVKAHKVRTDAQIAKSKAKAEAKKAARVSKRKTPEQIAAAGAGKRAKLADPRAKLVLDGSDPRHSLLVTATMNAPENASMQSAAAAQASNVLPTAAIPATTTTTTSTVVNPVLSGDASPSVVQLGAGDVVTTLTPTAPALADAQAQATAPETTVTVPAVTELTVPAAQASVLVAPPATTEMAAVKAAESPVSIDQEPVIGVTSLAPALTAQTPVPAITAGG